MSGEEENAEPQVVAEDAVLDPNEQPEEIGHVEEIEEAKEEEAKVEDEKPPKPEPITTPKKKQPKNSTPKSIGQPTAQKTV